jgi:hypothetical protein
MLVLVANGTTQGAAKPSDVLADLRRPSSTRICVVDLARNVQNTGGLNAGVNRALMIAGVEWIISVQSSAVLFSGWLNAVTQLHGTEPNGGRFGRMLIEDQTDRIWADGHFVDCGKTKNVNYCQPLVVHPTQVKPAIPCLSAAAFPRSIVEQVVQVYGTLVCENLQHYGDCTDVAFRILSINPDATFHFCPDAVATKRIPERNARIECYSQMLAARLYYDSSKVAIADSRAFKRLLGEFVEVQREVIERAGRWYACTQRTPPKAPKNIDQCWGY